MYFEGEQQEQKKGNNFLTFMAAVWPAIFQFSVDNLFMVMFVYERCNKVYPKSGLKAVNLEKKQKNNKGTKIDKQD